MNDLSSDERVRAFAFDGGPIGCLLVHGFTGTPSEMRPLGERLAKRGFTVRAPLLPGHGTRVDDLARTQWPQWFAAAAASWDELGERSDRRAVAGLSMGALLALHLAHERPREVRAVAALAPALELRSQRSADVMRWVRWLPPLPRRVLIVPKRGPMNRLTPAYHAVPLRALASMVELQRRVRAELPGITTPTLIVEGGRDETVAPNAARTIESALGSATKRRIRFETSGHILTEDVEAEAVIDAVEAFLSSHLG